MNIIPSTPVPNVLLDEHLKILKEVELKVLLIIVRQTLGWRDEKEKSGRKETDWISTGQLQSKSGSSRRGISSAIDRLVKLQLIMVSDLKGSILQTPQERKGKTKLFYRLSPTPKTHGDNEWKTDEEQTITNSPSAMIAEDLSKNITALAQKMRITKETLQN